MSHTYKPYTGRPRTVSLPPDEMVELGHEMLEWIKDNRPLHLSQWWCIEKGYTEKEWDTMQQAPEFVIFYQKAMRTIGLQYLQKNSDVEPALKQRWQRVYFKDLRRAEDEDAEAEAKRKADAVKGEARAAEEERQRVIDAIQRNNNPVKR